MNEKREPTLKCVWRKSAPVYADLFTLMIEGMISGIKWLINISLYLPVAFIHMIIDIVKWLVNNFTRLPSIFIHMVIDFFKWMFSKIFIYCMLLTIIFGEFYFILNKICGISTEISIIILGISMIISTPIWVSFGECTHMLPE